MKMTNERERERKFVLKLKYCERKCCFDFHHKIERIAGKTQHKKQLSCSSVV